MLFLAPADISPEAGHLIIGGRLMRTMGSGGRIACVVAAMAASVVLSSRPAEATAVNFDFSSFAIGHEGGNPAENDAAAIGLAFASTGLIGTSLTGGPTLQVVATGQNSNATGASGAPYAYLDDYDAGRPAGLGVCQTLNSSAQCVPNDDDNVTGNATFQEILTLTFSEAVSLSNVLFRDADHYALTAGTFLLNGVSQSFGTSDFTSLGSHAVWTFKFAGTQFYVKSLTASTDVPEPATTALLGLGLFGIAAAARRRPPKRAAA
ncbi:MAG: PEP-CTERM sorting domain-containing protein [Alphaproteobacteria bacterium]|nr:PEP-CTERM sorting domain-containing protein [Alphaproteobacteria bacterium]